jgi:hypothetical protein
MPLISTHARASTPQTFRINGFAGFHKMRVAVSNYTLRNHELKSWRMEVSMVGHEWIQVDHHVNDQHFRGGPPITLIQMVGTFSLAPPVECRFIRLFQDELNHNNNDFLTFSAVKLFGTPFEEKKTQSSNFHVHKFAGTALRLLQRVTQPESRAWNRTRETERPSPRFE